MGNILHDIWPSANLQSQAKRQEGLLLNVINKNISPFPGNIGAALF